MAKSKTLRMRIPVTVHLASESFDEISRAQRLAFALLGTIAALPGVAVVEANGQNVIQLAQPDPAQTDALDQLTATAPALVK